MELFVSLHDHEGFAHMKTKFDIEDKATLRELQKAISVAMNVDPRWQNIYLNDGRDICEIASSSLLTQLGLRDLDKLILKHSHIDKWTAYLNRVEEFKNAQVTETRKRSAEGAQRLHDILFESSFFAAYARFDIAVTMHHKSISKYLDKRTRWIRAAATNFFQLSMFKGQYPLVEFEETIDGTRSAVICNVTVDSINHKYRIKTSHNAGESRQASRWDFDLIELYCYKLLESIRVGPKIVFIPNFFTSKSIIYIGSEWLPEFQCFSSIEQVNSTDVSHAIVQIHFLAVYLSFGDIHEENFGLLGSSDPIIVDFMMSNYRDPKNKFLHDDNVIHSYKARDILNNCDSTARLQIAKDAIHKWNFMDKLDEVLELMDKEKAEFGLQKLDFDKKTKDLEEFVERVRSDIKDLFLD